MSEQITSINCTKRRRIAGLFAANGFSHVVNIVWQFAAVPMFLAVWSNQLYGEWLILTAIPGYLSLADGGLTAASANDVAMAIARGDLPAAQRSLHTACGFLLGVSAAMLAVMAALAHFAPWTAWLHLQALSQLDVCLILLALTVYTIVGFGFGLLGAVYRGAYRPSRIVVATSTCRLAELVAIAAGLIVSRSAVVIAAGMALVRIVIWLAAYFDSRGLSPLLRLGIVHFCWAETKRIWMPSLMFMAFTLGNSFYFQGLTLVTASTLGPAAVVIFNTTRALTRAIAQFVTIIKHSLWPEFSYLIGAGDLSGARKLNALAVEATWVSTLALAALLYAYGQEILKVWTHGHVSADRGLLALFLASAVLNSIWFVCSGLLMGANRHGRLGAAYVLGTAISIVIAIPLAGKYGLHGVALAMVVCEALLLPYALVETGKMLQQPTWTLCFDAARLRGSCSFAATRLARGNGGRT